MKPALRSASARIALLFAAVAAAGVLVSQPAPRERVGPLPDGSYLLNSGWRLQPAGRQIPLDTFPMASAVSPDGRYIVVLNGGYRPPSLSVIETASGKVVSSTPTPDGWLGLAFSSRTNRLYVGGGSRAAVFEFTLAEGKLQAGRSLAVVPAAQRTAQDFVGDVAISPDGRLIYAAQLYRDSIAVINVESGAVVGHYKTGRRPYRILFHPDGQTFFVSHWADGSVSHYDAASGSALETLRLGAHPTDMVWRTGGPPDPGPGEPSYAARLFVTAASTNRVYVTGVTASKQLSVIETINMAMTPRQPLGMTPSALGLSPDGNTLFVVCSDANAVGVVDISGERSDVSGFIPTGWYPTAVRALPSGALVILNGKGVRSYPNPGGPNPAKRLTEAGSAAVQYIPRIQTGTASWIEKLTGEQLLEWSNIAVANSAYTDDKLDESNKLPPIQHVIYIVKENRTYDQVLGDMKEGNGDPSLTLFGENVTPNHHKLAREFVLLDNFYVNGDVSAAGHNWTTAAISPDYVERLWPNTYAGRRSTYDYEEQDPTSVPPAGYLWTNAAAAGISIRNFGYMVNNAPKAAVGADQVASVRDPVLNKFTNRLYRGFDMEYPDVERAKVFLNELADYERTGAMPRLIFMRLGNDHTAGTTPDQTAPLSCVADNDYALGMIVEAVSKSKFWPQTAIFVLEDDAQNGPDHVDSHRSPAFLISPYVKRHTVDSTMYNTTSMLRTMEMLLGLRPMTHFDAGARLMTAAFQAGPDAAPFTAEKPRISLTEKNAATAPGAAASLRMNFEREDMIDDDELNEILWTAIRKDAPPPPVRSFFGK